MRSIDQEFEIVFAYGELCRQSGGKFLNLSDLAIYDDTYDDY